MFSVDLPPEVPAYVQQSKSSSGAVTVITGSNWDLSRSAVATPVLLIDNVADEQTSSKHDKKTAILTIRYPSNNVTLTPSQKNTLKSRFENCQKITINSFGSKEDSKNLAKINSIAESFNPSKLKITYSDKYENKAQISCDL